MDNQNLDKLCEERKQNELLKLADAVIREVSKSGVEFETLWISGNSSTSNISENYFDGVKLDFSEHDKRVTEELRTENEALRKRIEDLDRQNTDIQNSHMKLYNDSKAEIRALKDKILALESELEQEKNCYLKTDGNFLWMKPNEAKYIYENNELKAEIQRLKEKCGKASVDTEKSCASDDIMDYEELCCELQDQHQQDCILINNLNVTIDKLVDRYANLRKNVGMD